MTSGIHVLHAHCSPDLAHRKLSDPQSCLLPCHPKIARGACQSWLVTAQGLELRPPLCPPHLLQPQARLPPAQQHCVINTCSLGRCDFKQGP